MKPYHGRKPMRLPGYDYSMPGAYFVTACTKNRDFLFETLDTKLAVESAWYSVFDMFANIIGAFKTTTATRVNKLHNLVGVPVWQKSFYDRIIRNDHELERIQEYIRNNPKNWVEDRDNLTGPKFGSPARSVDVYWKEIFG